MAPAEPGALWRPRISVVVPVYNGGQTLGRCLDALIASLPPGGDVIVVDDGSTDDTASRVQERQGGPPLRLVRHPQNRGTSAARNSGWTASVAPLIAFVDADMVLRAGALTALVNVLERDPDLLGANGTLSLDLERDLDDPDAVTDFVNTSLHWQLSRHGDRVSSAFTAICVFRRDVLEQMGGWDERWFSRYADDVSTRFRLPPGALAQVADARGAHLKRVPLRGLVKHRFNVGYFFVSSVAANRGRAHRDNTVLDLRYPLNTAAAAVTAGGLSVALVLGPLGLLLLPLGLVPVGVHVVVNARFCRFVAQERGLARAAQALPLSAIEGYAYGAGMAAGVVALLRRRLGRGAAGSGGSR